MSGKGSRPRPIPNRKEFEDSWEAIFGKKNKTDDELEQTESPSGSKSASKREANNDKRQ